MDLGVPKNIKGVIIQGARGGDSMTTTESRSFVKKFKVAYSMNGKDWDFIRDPKTMQAKVGTAWSSCKIRYVAGYLQSASWGLGKLALSPLVRLWEFGLSSRNPRLCPLVLLLSCARDCRFHLASGMAISLHFSLWTRPGDVNNTLWSSQLL